MTMSDSPTFLYYNVCTPGNTCFGAIILITHYENDGGGAGIRIDPAHTGISGFRFGSDDTVGGWRTKYTRVTASHTGTSLLYPGFGRKIDAPRAGHTHAGAADERSLRCAAY